MLAMSPVFPLNWKDDVRAATRSSGIRARAFSSSSARPSAKYSWSFSALMSTKGRTAIEARRVLPRPPPAVPRAALPAEPERRPASGQATAPTAIQARAGRQAAAAAMARPRSPAPSVSRRSR